MFGALKKRWADAGLVAGIIGLAVAVRDNNAVRVPQLVGSIGTHFVKYGEEAFFRALGDALKAEKPGATRGAILMGTTAYFQIIGRIEAFEDQLQSLTSGAIFE